MLSWWLTNPGPGSRRVLARDGRAVLYHIAPAPDTRVSPGPGGRVLARARQARETRPERPLDDQDRRETMRTSRPNRATTTAALHRLRTGRTWMSGPISRAACRRLACGLGGCAVAGALMGAIALSALAQS